MMNRASSKKRQKKPMGFPSTVVEEWVASAMEFASPAMEELLPDLSRDEQLHLFRHWEKKKHQQSSPPYAECERDMVMIPKVHLALRHYNATHPGGEFDPVKPLMEASVRFSGQIWYHINFWARSRHNNPPSRAIIKRFFAEIHYKTPSFTSLSALPCLPAPPIPVVEICTIIGEPLSQYRSSCAFCAGHLDILHPKGCRKFVCGNDKDRFQQRLERPAGLRLCAGARIGGLIGGMPPLAVASSSSSSSGSEEEQDDQDTTN